MSTYHLQLPGICNQNCIFCCVNAQRLPSPKNLLIPPLYREILAETNEGDEILIGGGEPTRWENIATFFQVIQRMNRTSYVITNGSYPERLSKLIQLGMNRVVFSFFTLDEASHNKITDSKHYSKLLESLDLFKKMSLPI